MLITGSVYCWIVFNADILLRTFAFLLFSFFFCFSPQIPPVHSCIFFSCGMWDTASVWAIELCHAPARIQTSKTLGCRSRVLNLTTWPRGRPRHLLILYAKIHTHMHRHTPFYTMNMYVCSCVCVCIT